MKHKHFLFNIYLLISVFLVSCNNNSQIIEYNEDGSIKYKIVNINDSTKKVTEFDAGNIYKEYYKINDKLEGKYIIYFQRSKYAKGRTFRRGKHIIDYKNGKMHGKSITILDDSLISEIESYHEGKLDGECIYYDTLNRVFMRKFYVSNLCKIKQINEYPDENINYEVYWSGVRKTQKAFTKKIYYRPCIIKSFFQYPKTDKKYFSDNLPVNKSEYVDGQLLFDKEGNIIPSEIGYYVYSDSGDTISFGENYFGTIEVYIKDKIDSLEIEIENYHNNLRDTLIKFSSDTLSFQFSILKPKAGRNKITGQIGIFWYGNDKYFTGRVWNLYKYFYVSN